MVNLDPIRMFILKTINDRKPKTNPIISLISCRVGGKNQKKTGFEVVWFIRYLETKNKIFYLKKFKTKT